MRKILLSSAAALALTCTAANAIPLTQIVDPTGNFQFDDLAPAAPTFSDTFTFTAARTGNFSVTFTEVGSAEFTGGTFGGRALSFLSAPGGEPDFGFFNNLFLTAGSVFTLVINGTNTSPSTSGGISGNTSFTPVPVPGPIAGAGIPALLAAFGVWAWNRRRPSLVHQA